MTAMLQRMTRFDLTVLIASLTLTLVIGLSAALGISDRALRVAYLKLGPDRVYNVWIADPNNPADARQVTFAPDGVFDFDVSPNGNFIVFAEQDFQMGASDLYMLDLRTNRVTPLTNCRTQDADCSAPAIRPDGSLVAYQRVALNRNLPTVGAGSIRIWVVDLTTNPPQTFPLVDDDQIVGYGPRWSADGSRLAFYDNRNYGILVHEYGAPDDRAWAFIPSDFGEVGSLSPDGTRMVYPEMLIDGAMTRAFLQMAELDAGIFRPLTDPNEAADDQATAWNPNGRFIAIGRIYRDERFTRGAQVYLIDSETNALSSLIVDPRYANGFFRWDPSGQRLALQRFQQLDDQGQVYADGTTEVWTYDMETRRLVQIATDARGPIWVP